MYVQKRDGRQEEMLLDKITSRIKKLCYGLDKEYVDPMAITLKVSGSHTEYSTLRESCRAGPGPRRGARRRHCNAVSARCERPCPALLCAVAVKGAPPRAF